MRNTTLLTKMIIFGCVVSILPVLFVGMFSYERSSKQVQEQVNQGEVQYIKQVNSNIEQILVAVNHTLTNLADSTVMDEALGQPLDEHDFQLYNHLRDEISHLQSFDTKVEDVVILNKKQDWLIKNSGLYRLHDHPDRNKYTSFLNMEYNSEWVLLRSAEFSDPITNSDVFRPACEYTISLVRKLPVRTSNMYGLALANIPTCGLADMIDYDRGAKEVMIVDTNYRIVADSNRAMIGKSLLETPYIERTSLFAADSGQFPVTSKNRSYTVTYYKSGFNHWIYLSIVSIDQLTQESKQIGWFTLYICLAIIAISVLFVWLTTRQLYSPVKKIVQFIEGRQPDHDEKKQNELQIIEAHLKNLFSSNSKLEHEIRDHTGQIRSLFLHRLYGGGMRYAEIREKMEYFGLDRVADGWNYMTVLTLQIDTLENTRYERKDMELLLFAVANILEETIPKENRLPSVSIDQTLVALIGVRDSDIGQLKEYVYHLTEKLRERVATYLNLSVSIGISLPFNEIDKADRAYQEGLEALKHRIKLGKDVIIHYSSINSGQHSIIYQYPQRTEMELLDAIKIADREEALKQLRQWIHKAFLNDQTPREYRISMMRLMNNLLTIKQEAGISFEQIDAHHASLYEELLALQMSEEIEEWFKNRLILPLIQVFDDREGSQYQNLSEQIVDLIHNYYDTDITLEECASKLHYNANYLSSVFKKETGSTFSEYLSNYRLLTAKKWLLETDMTVREIADKLRYTNPQNFIRSFRKQEDMTPGQYRLLKP